MRLPTSLCVKKKKSTAIFLCMLTDFQKGFMHRKRELNCMFGDWIVSRGVTREWITFEPPSSVSPPVSLPVGLLQLTLTWPMGFHGFPGCWEVCLPPLPCSRPKPLSFHQAGKSHNCLTSWSTYSACLCADLRRVTSHTAALLLCIYFSLGPTEHQLCESFTLVIQFLKHKQKLFIYLHFYYLLITLCYS